VIVLCWCDGGFFFFFFLNLLNEFHCTFIVIIKINFDVSNRKSLYVWGWSCINFTPLPHISMDRISAWFGIAASSPGGLACSNSIAKDWVIEFFLELSKRSIRWHCISGFLAPLLLLVSVTLSWLGERRSKGGGLQLADELGMTVCDSISCHRRISYSLFNCMRPSGFGIEGNCHS